MKTLEIDSNVDIPKDTVINYKLGVKVRDNEVLDYRDNYDYVDFGNYIVQTSEKQEDLLSYKITCYDKMLYFMKPFQKIMEYIETEDTEFDVDKTYYTSPGVEYTGATTGNPHTLELLEYVPVSFPITIRDYITKLCDFIGIDFANESDTFVNYNKQIKKELYLADDGSSLDYTYRDVLDELAQVTASTICINNNDELEIRYIQNAGTYETATGTTITIPNVEDSKDIEITLKGNTTQNGTPTPDNPVNVNVVTGLNTIDVCGKNLINCTSPTTTEVNLTVTRNGDGSYTLNGTNKSSTWWFRLCPNFELPAGTYTLSNSNDNVGNETAVFYDDENNFTTRTDVDTKTFNSSVIIKPYIRVAANQTFNNFTIKPMIEKGSTATEFEPYIGQSYDINLGDIELCKIGTYQDRIYKDGDSWYIEKKVGKAVLDNTYYRSRGTTGTNAYYLLTTLTTPINDNINLVYSNMFQPATFMNKNNGLDVVYSQNGMVVLRTANNTSINWSDETNCKNWLDSNNPILYYVLPTTTYTKITDSDLIGQLEDIRLLNGVNNITSSVPIDLTYLSERDTIDEEYLKDINVNFGEKYGPINSVVFSRSAESDNIYRKDDSSITLNGLCELKISDNQILNDDNREDFIDGVFDELKGLEYYINDYTSTGICYYELCDKYNISIDSNVYSCIMLNDEVNITQGLEELVHTELLEQSETDYTKADKTDRNIYKTSLIVDKQQGVIQGLVGRTETLENETEQFIGTTFTQTINDVKIEVKGYTDNKTQNLQDQIDNIDASETQTLKNNLVTIDVDGIHVSTDTSRIQTLIDNDEFSITDSGQEKLAWFGYDEEHNESVAQMSNLTITKYLIAGNHRVEKYGDSDERTGWFYIGGS